MGLTDSALEGREEDPEVRSFAKDIMLRVTEEEIERALSADPSGADWLNDARAQLEHAGAGTTFWVMFARVARKLAKSPRPGPMGEPWQACDWGRLALLLVVLRDLEEAPAVSIVERVIQGGELGEQQSVLRVLAYLPEAARYVAIAVDACRTNAESVFASIACENGYPSRFFSNLSFNQMVLKALFLGVDVRRIVGLRERMTPELRRMARDYGREREAAGRTVPDDVRYLEALLRADP